MPEEVGGEDAVRCLINLKVNNNCGGKRISFVCRLSAVSKILDGDSNNNFNLRCFYLAMVADCECRWQRESDTCDPTDRVPISVNKIRFRCQDTGKARIYNHCMLFVREPIQTHHPHSIHFIPTPVTIHIRIVETL